MSHNTCQFLLQVYLYIKFSPLLISALALHFTRLSYLTLTILRGAQNKPDSVTIARGDTINTLVEEQ